MVSVMVAVMVAVMVSVMVAVMVVVMVSVMAAILRRRAGYGGWIGLVTSAGKQMSCIVGLCRLAAGIHSPLRGPYP
jgi:hypothetical protein